MLKISPTFCFSRVEFHLSPLLCVSMCPRSVAQSCPALCDPMDCSLLGSSIHGISKARILEREVGGGIGMGNTCKPMAVSFQCMTKFTTNKKKKEKKRKEKKKNTGVGCHILLQGSSQTSMNGTHISCISNTGGFFTSKPPGEPPPLLQWP